MKILFDDGEILMVTREWLESTSQTKMANASLMIANIARSGLCVIMGIGLSCTSDHFAVQIVIVLI